MAASIWRTTARNPPKLLEYNADTPTSLLEAAVVQWYWLQDVFPKRDQFNSLHERLVALWKELAPVPARQAHRFLLDGRRRRRHDRHLSAGHGAAGRVSTPPFSRSTKSAGTAARFVGPDDQPLGAVFKLYPWEWMVREEFGKHIGVADTLWIEPPWKMLLSNKGILPVLGSCIPRHPYLLEASFDGPGPDDVLGEEAAARARRRQHPAASAGQGHRD